MATREELLKEYAARRQATSRYKNVEEWGEFVSLDYFTEFNVIFPVMLEGRDVLTAVKGARFSEPAVVDGSYFDELRVSLTDAQEMKVFDDAIVSTSTGQSARLRKDGTIEYRTVKGTQVIVRVNGKLMLVHSHSSPHGDESPPYHDRDQFGPKDR
jgi:hypothetical protein